MSGAGRKERKENPEEPPPFLGSWRNVYVFVICYVACLIGAFYLFSLAVRP